MEQGNYSNENQGNMNLPEDKPGIGWQILAFLIPIAGLIMYFNTKKDFPNKANRYLLLAGISFAIGLMARLS